MSLTPNLIRKPNFFIVGAPKSGTTAMDKYLSEHPDIFMAAKEPHFFARDLLPKGDRNLDPANYAQRFEKVTDEKIVGEASVFYLYSQVAASLIKDFSPDARILIHLRDPVDFIASHHSQVIFEGGETVTDLEEALRLEPFRRKGEQMPDFIWNKALLYTEIASFSTQVERFQETFGKDRVLINLFDDFRRDTAACFRRTLEFLDVDPDFQGSFEVVNANKTIRNEWLMKAVRNPPEWISLPSRILFPPKMRTAIKERVRTANTRYTQREPMSESLRSQLREKLRPDIERLQTLIDRDLGDWIAPH
jgi:hypothetical protein